MKLTRYHVLLSLACSCLAACNNEMAEDLVEKRTLTIGSSIESFEEEGITRASVDGKAFDANDKIRLKIICPFVDGAQLGESTWNGTRDWLWLLKWSGSGWDQMTAAQDHYDITGTYEEGDSQNLYGIYEAQATPYVYTAITWSEEKVIKDSDGEVLVYYSNVFHADQSREKRYKASDLLWAQQYTQTGAWNIHLSFNHVMSALLITLDDSALPEGEKISSDAILSLAGMPDIDQGEIVVGDYYAAKDKYNNPNGYRYGYKVKSTCDYENNGKVIGVVNEKANFHTFTGGVSDTHKTSATPVANTATYTCYHDPTLDPGPESGDTYQTYRLIVPPCVLQSEAEFLLRDDTRRFKMRLKRTVFEQGKLYPITIKVGVADSPAAPNPDPANPGTDPTNP